MKTMKSYNLKIKLIIIFSVLFFNFLTYHAFATTIKTEAKIKNVTVYTDAALIGNKASYNITSQGNHKIVVQGISQFINENSIELLGTNDLVILGVNVSRNYINEENKPQFLKQLEDTLKEKQKAANQISNQIAAYNVQLNAINSNLEIKGNNSGLNLAEFEKFLTLINSKTIELNNKIFDSNLQLNKVNKKIEALQNQINQYNAKNSNTTSEIEIELIANSPAKGEFELNYICSNAGWSSIYDIKAESSKNSISLVNQAKVFQSTGLDWNNIKLTLSTGNANVSLNIPEINTQYITYYLEGQKRTIQQKQKTRAKSEAYYTGAEPAAARAYDDNSNVQQLIISNVESTVNNNYEINLPYTIKSDGKETIVEIGKENYPVITKYICIPKLDNSVFLNAKVMNLSESGLNSGDASVFLDGNFVGNTYLDFSGTKDTLSISLGRDKNITVSRKQTKIFTDKNMAGNFKSTTKEFDITIKNKRKSEVSIELIDQIPLSQNEEIVVEMLQAKDALYEKETGKLTWNLKVNSNDNKTVKFGYSVKYPKKFILNNY